MGSYRYATLLQSDVRAASIFHKWRRGLPPTNDDYIYLQELTYRTEPPNEAAYGLIFDVLNEICTHWVGDALAYYYGIFDTSSEFHTRASALLPVVDACISAAIRFNGRKEVEAYSALVPGADWTRLLVDQMRLSTWGALGLKHLDFTTLGDDEFRVRFEEEWSRLLHFPDLFYGFRVVPRVGLDDFVRYSLLPHADANIRGQISNYFLHQWSEYPHLGQLMAPKFADVAFGKRLRTIYRPLIEKVAREALRNLQVPGDDERAKADMETQVSKAFEDAMKKFRFYGPHKRKRLWGKIGVIGLPQTPELRSYFDEGAKKRGMYHEGEPVTLSHLSEVGFAYYIDLKLRAWLQRNYPPESRSREVVGDNFIEGSSQTYKAEGAETFTGTDGVPYLQRRAAALICGVTEDQLRNWDRDGSLPAKRAEDVLPTPLPEGVRKEHRLYPYTPEALEKVRGLSLRKATRSTQAGTGECTRKMAAVAVGVPSTTLLHWENKGLLCPDKRGRSVIYSAQDIETARGLKKERHSKTK